MPQNDTDAWAMPPQGKSRFCFCQRPFMFTGYEALSDTGSVAPQLMGNPYLTGISPDTANSAAATPNVSAERQRWERRGPGCSEIRRECLTSRREYLLHSIQSSDSASIVN